MRKKFITNLALVLFLNILVKPFWVIGIDRTVQNTVGPSDYGLYFSLFNLSLIFNIILDLGLTNYNNRNISQHNQLLSKFFSNLVVLKLMLGVLYATFCVTLGFLLNYSWLQFHILLLLIFNQFLSSFILYLRSNISGLQMFKTDSLISVIDRLLMIAILSFLLWSKYVETSFKIEWFVYAQTFAYMITVLVAFFIVFFKSVFFKIKFDKIFLLSILRQTYPYALLVFLMSLYLRFDGFILERLLPDGKEQTGIYAQAFRLLDAVAQFALLFAGLLLPMFSKMLKEKESINSLVKFSFLLVIVPSIITVVSSIIYRHEIMSVLYDNEIESSASIFAVLITSFIPISANYIFGTLLTANGNIKQLNIISAIGVVINLSLNIILIMQYKALGAAISGFITQCYTCTTQFLLAKHIFKFRINIKYAIAFTLYIIILFFLFNLFREVIENWMLGISLSIVTGIILGMLFRLLNIRTFIAILKSK